MRNLFLDNVIKKEPIIEYNPISLEDVIEVIQAPKTIDNIMNDFNDFFTASIEDSLSDETKRMLLNISQEDLNLFHSIESNGKIKSIIEAVKKFVGKIIDWIKNILKIISSKFKTSKMNGDKIDDLCKDVKNKKDAEARLKKNKERILSLEDNFDKDVKYIMDMVSMQLYMNSVEAPTILPTVEYINKTNKPFFISYTEDTLTRVDPNKNFVTHKEDMSKYGYHNYITFKEFYDFSFDFEENSYMKELEDLRLSLAKVKDNNDLKVIKNKINVHSSILKTYSKMLRTYFKIESIIK